MRKGLKTLVVTASAVALLSGAVLLYPSVSKAFQNKASGVASDPGAVFGKYILAPEPILAQAKPMLKVDSADMTEPGTTPDSAVHYYPNEACWKVIDTVEARTRAGDTAGAISALDDALRKPDWAPGDKVSLYRRRAWLWIEKGEWKAAAADYERAIEEIGSNDLCEEMRLRQAQVFCYKSLGDWQAANSACRTAIGKLDAKIAKFERGERMVGFAGRYYDTLAADSYYYDRGIFYSLMKKWGKAVRDLNHVLECRDPRNSNYGYVLQTLGEVYHEAGRYRKAVWYYSRAVEKYNEKADATPLMRAYESRAKSYDRLGLKRKADADREEAKRIEEKYK